MRRHIIARSTIAVVAAIGLLDARPEAEQHAGTYLKDNGIVAALRRELRELRAYPHLDRAYQLVEQNQLADARVEFERHLAIDPQHTAARTGYVLLLYRMRDYAAAVTQADIAIRQDAQSVDVRLYRAMANHAAGRANAAVQDFRVVVAAKNAPDQARRYALDSIADIALAAGRFDEASAALDALVALQPDYRVYLRQGRSHEALGDVDRAEAAYRFALSAARTSKERVDALRGIAAVARRRKRWDSARSALVAAERADPSDMDTLQDLVDTASAAKDFTAAARWMNVALAHKPTADRRLALAELLSSAGDYNEALAQFSAVVPPAASRQAQYRALMGAGHSYTKLGQHTQAAAKFSEAATLHHDGPTLAARAQALELAGNTRAAISAWHDAIRTKPSAEYLLHAGFLEAKTDRNAAAIRDLTTALHGRLTTADRVMALRQLGSTYRAAGNLPAAARALKRATTTDRRDTASHVALAEVYLASGDAAAAVSEAQRALAIAEDPSAWRVLAAADAKAGRTAEAANIYRRLASGTQSRIEAANLWMATGNVEFERKNYGGAAAAFRSAYMSSGGANIDGLMHAAEAEIAADKWAAAEADLVTVVAQRDALASVRGSAYERLGIVYSKLDRPTDAAAAFRSAIDFGRGEPVVHENLGYALFKLERWREAIDAFRSALAGAPSARVQAALSQAYERLGKSGVALHLVRQALELSRDVDRASRRQLLSGAGYLYARQYEWTRAADAFAAAIAIEPDADTLLALAAARRMSGDSDGALRTLDRVEAGSLPPAAYVRYLDERASVLTELRQHGRAAELRAEAQRLQPSALRSYELGLAAGRQQRSKEAVSHLEAAVSSEPGNTRYLEALGYAYKHVDRLSDAARTFEAVLRIDPDYLPVYEELAYIYQKIGPIADARSWLTRAIDNTPLLSAEAGTGVASRAIQQHNYDLRRAYLDLSTRFDATAYTLVRSESASASAVTSGTTGGAIPSSSGIEVAYRFFEPLAARPRIHLFVRASADIAGAAPSGEPNHDQLSLGVRYQPLTKVNFAVSAERAFAGNPLGPWLLRGLYSWDSGYTLRSGTRRWRYAFVLADAAVVPQGRQETAAYVETRQGVTFNIRDMWLVTPHVVADGRIADGPAFSGATDRYVEAGLGSSFKYLFKEDAYRSHRAALEFILQYRRRRDEAGPASNNGGGFVMMTVVNVK